MERLEAASKAESNRQRLGVFGGTFDPPHLGHLILAECALDALRLSRVLFVLAADPPHKRDQHVTPLRHRLVMLERAIAGNQRFVLSRIDIDRPGPHYSADTLHLLSDEQPEADLVFLMGGDSLDAFPTWHDPTRILAHARLGVMQRPGNAIDMRALEKRLPPLNGRVLFFDAPEIGISATSLRERVHVRHSIRYQVPEGVADYIHEHQLYEDLL